MRLMLTSKAWHMTAAKVGANRGKSGVAESDITLLAVSECAPRSVTGLFTLIIYNRSGSPQEHNGTV